MLFDKAVPPCIADMINETILGDDVVKAFVDDGESCVLDPVGDFLAKLNMNPALNRETRAINERFAKRFNTTDGAPLAKRLRDDDPFAMALKKASKARLDGNVMRLWDSNGNLLAEKEVGE